VKEDIKTAFERAASTFDARADAAKQQRDQDLTERQQFEEGYRRKRDDVILPALKAVTNILEPHGWTCKISESKTGSTTKFEVFRGNMKGASATRPHINFSADAGSREVTIHKATQTPGPPKLTCSLTELTEESVGKFILEFFEQLTSEPLNADGVMSKPAQ
jgi:hypothetical protein